MKRSRVTGAAGGIGRVTALRLAQEGARVLAVDIKAAELDETVSLGQGAIEGQVADLHCAPTPRAREALLAEGVTPDRIAVTGNPVVDSLHWMQRHRSTHVPVVLT